MRFPFSTRVLTTTLALQLFQVMRLGSAVLTGILLAKSGLSTTTIGAWEMLLYIGTTFTFFWVNGLLQGMAPMHARLDEGAQKVFVFNNFLVFCTISLGLFLVLMLGEKWLAPLLTGLSEVPFFRLFCVYLLLNLPSFPVEYLYLLQQRPGHIIIWGVAVFGLHLAALLVPIVLGYGLEGGVWALVGLAGAKFLWTIRLVSEYGRWQVDIQLMQRYLLFCAPLMLSSVVSNLMLLFDNWLVGWHFQDAGVFAIYRYGAREFPLATALVSALGTAMIPRLTTNPVAGLEETKAKMLRLMHLLFPLTMVLILTSHWFFPLVFNPDFQSSAVLFNIYLLTLASRVLLPASIVLSKGDSSSIFQVSLAEMVLKMVLGFWFIQWWGLTGLAWSVVVSFWVEKLGLILILERQHHIRTRDWLHWKWYLGYVCALFLTYWLVGA